MLFSLFVFLELPVRNKFDYHYNIISMNSSSIHFEMSPAVLCPVTFLTTFILSKLSFFHLFFCFSPSPMFTLIQLVVFPPFGISPLKPFCVLICHCSSQTTQHLTRNYDKPWLTNSKASLKSSDSFESQGSSTEVY